VFLATPPDADTKNDRACPVALMQVDPFGGLRVHPAKTLDGALRRARAFRTGFSRVRPVAVAHIDSDGMIKGVALVVWSCS